MPTHRFLNLAAEARGQLLTIATKHFAARGFEGASLNEILSEAGISKGAYYYYFEDKDDLFATALEAAIDSVLGRLPLPKFSQLTAKNFWPTVERFVSKWAAEFDLSSELIQAAAQLTEAQRRSPRYAAVFAKGQRLYRELISAGQAVGCVRSDLPMNVLLRLVEANDTVLDSIFMETHTTIKPAHLDGHVRLVFDTFKRLLIADPSAVARHTKTARARRA